MDELRAHNLNLQFSSKKKNTLIELLISKCFCNASVSALFLYPDIIQKSQNENVQVYFIN